MLFYCVDEKLGYWFTYVMVNLHDIYIALWCVVLLSGWLHQQYILLYPLPFTIFFYPKLFTSLITCAFV